MNPGWRGNYLRYQSYFLNVIARYKERADIKAYIEILLSLATVSIFAVFALRPTLLTIAELIKEIETKEAVLDEMKAKINSLTSAQVLYDRERSRINSLLTSITEKPDPEIYARQIEGLSQKHNSNIVEITAGEAVIVGKDRKTNKKEADYVNSFPEQAQSMAVSAIFTTSLDQYVNFANLISDFEKSRKPAQIDTLRIKVITNEDSEKEIELEISSRLPYFIKSD